MLGAVEIVLMFFGCAIIAISASEGRSPGGLLEWGIIIADVIIGIKWMTGGLLW